MSLSVAFADPTLHLQFSRRNPCIGRSLEQLLKDQPEGKLSESEARTVTRELACAVSHCHARFVVHRDIKPANILITSSGKVMLIDFGLGNVFSHRSRLNTICGSFFSWIT